MGLRDRSSHTRVTASQISGPAIMEIHTVDLRLGIIRCADIQCVCLRSGERRFTGSPASPGCCALATVECRQAPNYNARPQGCHLLVGEIKNPEVSQPGLKGRRAQRHELEVMVPVWCTGSNRGKLETDGEMVKLMDLMDLEETLYDGLTRRG